MSYIGQGLEQAYSERYVFTAAGGETSVSVADDGRTVAYVIGQVDVYKNGLRLVSGNDFSASSGTSITGLATLSAGDVVEIVAYAVVIAPDAVSASAGGTFQDAITVQGAVSATGVVSASGGSSTDWNAAYSWGNHASAGYLTGNQTITLTGDVTGSGTTSIAVTIADDSHSHVISNVDGLQTALDSKLPSATWTGSAASGITATQVTNWDTAYGWGNHASAGYLTSFTETDPVFSASAASGISSTNITNWNTAYGWGDHASAGYQAASTALTTSTTFGGDVSGTYNAIVIADDSHTHDGRYYTESEADSRFPVNGSGGITIGNSTASEVDIAYLSSSGSWQNGINDYYGTSSWFWYKDSSASYRGGLDASANLFIEGSVRAPIFYDKTDTAYYVNPNADSQFSQVYANNWFRAQGATGLYGNSYGNHFYPDSANYWNVAIGGQANGGLRFRDNHAGTIRGYVYVDTSNNIGFLNNAGSWRARVVGGDYFLTEGSSIRGQIYYDSNNTGYYVDPAGATSATFAQFVQIGDSSSYGTNSGGWGARLNVTDNVHAKIEVGQDANGMLSHWYAHTGQSSVKFGTSSSHDLEIQRGSTQKLYIGASETTSYNPLVVSANWGTGSYSDALTVYGTYPSITLRSTNANGGTGQTFLMHTDSSGTIQYYFDTSGPYEGWTKRHEFFSNGRFDATDNIRAPLFYDYNDTGYYVDPAGTSRLNAVNFTNLYYAVNTNYGFKGQNVYADTINSGIASDALELCYYSGAYTTSGGSMRAPLFYDLNDTGYYVDPASTSNMYDVSAHAFLGNANVAGTGQAIYCPYGIYSTGNNWLYGTMYTNGNDTYYSAGSVRSVADIVSDQNYGYGVVGVYSPSVYQHVWSMGASYRLAANGVSSGTGGNLYGLAWSYNPGYGYSGSNAQSKSGLNHQLLLMQNGTTTFAAGSGVWTNGNVTAYSDRRVKTNIEVIPDALTKVGKLSGYTFDRTDVEEDPSTGETPVVRQTGVIAQEVLEVLPEAVMGSHEEGYSVAYGNMVGLLIEAIKEQQTQIEAMAAEIKSLKEMKQ